MKVCPRCGTELRDEARFCDRCGARQEETPEHQTSVQAQASDAAVIAQERGLAAGVVAVGRDVHGDVILVADPDLLWRAIRRRSPSMDLRQATKRYLAYLVDRYRYLDFKGMGVSDRVPLRLPLVEMYVPLKARIELPEGETWVRDLRLAGREIPEEARGAIGERLSEPRPVLNLLQEHEGLVVLGDPGAGKTTFLKYLALKLASGEGEDLGLGVRLPVLVPLSAYANALAERDVRLDDFVAAYFRERVADLPVEAMLAEVLEKGSALVLLDGLDEVKDLALRQTVVERVVDFYTFHRKAGNRFVVTSRIIGYREVRPTAEGLVECTLVDFGDEEIEAFVTKWTAVLEKAARGDTAMAAQEAERERRELLEAIHRNPGVRRLAANPLLLTILALMKRQGVTLPERRVELYDQYVRTLLSSWNRARGLGRPPTRDLDVVETVRVLAPLALWMHEVAPGVGLVKREDLRRKLEAIYEERGKPDPEAAARQFLDDVREYAGLLVERGAGRYGFIHLTFEEYLAAVGIARLGQREIGPIVERLAAHVGDPAWREVALLTIGYLGLVQQWEEMASDVVEALVEAMPGEPGQVAVLAGDAVVDVWPGGVTPACKERIVQVLLDTVRDDRQVKAPLRAAAGDALARLGDPRPGVGVDPETGLPAIVWCHVPPGPFVMGSVKGEEKASPEERPQQTLRLSGFLISRYPITNSQYCPFVEGGGYDDKHYWTEEGWAWRIGEREADLHLIEDEKQRRSYAEWLAGRPADKRSQPYWWGDSQWGLPNRPAVGLTWYEALAFCRWLTERLRASSCNLRVWSNGQFVPLHLEPKTITVRLPTEAEWEKAARGTDGRRWPWGNEWSVQWANVEETGIGQTCAVGCFPGGRSPYGALDMAGNVWEWTSSLYRPYPYRADDGREDLSATGMRVVRGGCWHAGPKEARCAARGRLVPEHFFHSLGFRVVIPLASTPGVLAVGC